MIAALRVRGLWSLGFLACLLGNFVDQFDLYLFTSLRIVSLKSLGVEGDAALSVGAWLLNSQLIGMLVGGVVGGIIGDRRGRISILFGSIVLYSLANIANAFVVNVEQYLVCRFLAGLGLAAELGICITVVLETLPAPLRGYGTMLMMACGHAATFLSSLVINFFSWRECYVLGGVMGLAVLALRTQAPEPRLFLRLQNEGIQGGQFGRLLREPTLFRRYAASILVATPFWFTFAVLIVFAPEFGKAIGLPEEVSPAVYLPLNFAAVIAGDVVSGLWAQHLRQRRPVIAAYMLGLAVCTSLYLAASPSLVAFYLLIMAFGFFAGYAVQSYTLVGEQFGTNLRATVTTSTPNFARASAVISTTSFLALKPSLGVIPAAAVVGTVCFALAGSALLHLRESFGNDLDFYD